MSDNARLDDELAAFTDSVLAGREIRVSDELEPLTHVVRQLHSTIAPDTPASTAFRTHLTQRLIREWNLIHQRPSRLGRFTQTRPVLVLAASLLLVLLAVVLLANHEGDDNAPLQGTALGPVGWEIIIVAGVLITAGLLVWWYRQRTKR